MTTMVACASAEAVFGSASRGDTDSLSDRDILIVDDDVSVLRHRARELESDGWSVASYTFARLSSMANRGALFVQHLKLESRIVHDRDGTLHRLLSTFEPRNNYRSELCANDELARLAGVVPRGPRGTLLAADILYVTVRNFGVLSLAERGIHIYAYSSILEALAAEGLISSGGVRPLMGLRFLKCLYRTGEKNEGLNARYAVAQALAVLPTAHFPRTASLVDPQQILAQRAHPRHGGSYLQLRDLERRWVALEAVSPGAAHRADFAKLRDWIANPRAYAAISARLAPQLHSLISQKATTVRRRQCDGQSRVSSA